jgi:hypothetical protein
MKKRTAPSTRLSPMVYKARGCIWREVERRAEAKQTDSGKPLENCFSGAEIEAFLIARKGIIVQLAFL